MSEDPALEIGVDLSLDESDDRRALPSHPRQEGLELFADDFVEQGLFRFVVLVEDGAKKSTGTQKQSVLHANARDVPVRIQDVFAHTLLTN